MQIDLIIRNGRFVTSDGIVDGDLTISDGQITEIGHVRGQAKQEIEAEGEFVTPGGVDVHAHIEQMSGMGLMNADTFETATRSAAIGGTTTVISFAAQAKGQRLTAAMDDYARRASRGSIIDHAFHIIASDTAVSGFHDDLRQLIESGHRSIKVFTTYNIRLSDRDILEVMTTARHAGALVCVHAENDAMIGFTKDRLLAAEKSTPSAHALSHPRLAEVEAVERMIRFAEFLGQPVMLFHISTAEALEAVRRGRARGAPVWAETCPHYLLMSEDVLDAPGVTGAKWMCSPPQRTNADSAALWDGLADGTLDLVSSDHAPYRFDETGKLSAGTAPRFDQIANGLPGLETRMPLLFDAMVSHDRGGIEAFVNATATAPAKLYGLSRKGEIKTGMDADLVIWSGGKTANYGENDLSDNVGYNPWNGRNITGWPGTVLLRGKVIAKNGACLGRPGTGQRQHRSAIGALTTSEPAPELSGIIET